MTQALREALERKQRAVRHVCCYSGGESSAIVAIEVARRFGPENVTLVNHDMHFTVEHPDIKRFKREIAAYIDVPVTYVNYKNAQLDQFDVCVQAKAFKVRDGSELCTNRLKTKPFHDWLVKTFPEKGAVIYYGFDGDSKREHKRMQQRSSILAEQGFRSDYPLQLWAERTIHATEEVGIARPLTYDVFQHGNCVGCLKAGWQHWYIVYCTRPDIWLKAKWAEEEIGYAIHHDDESGPVYLEDMESRFAEMQAAGVPATERTQSQTWWAQARKIVKIHQTRETMPCECSN